jgi:hypothetical protein
VGGLVDFDAGDAGDDERRRDRCGRGLGLRLARALGGELPAGEDRRAVGLGGGQRLGLRRGPDTGHQLVVGAGRGLDVHAGPVEVGRANRARTLFTSVGN